MKMENDGGAAIECARCREREWWPVGKRGMRWSRCWCVEEMVREEKMMWQDLIG